MNRSLFSLSRSSLFDLVLGIFAVGFVVVVLVLVLRPETSSNETDNLGIEDSLADLGDFAGFGGPGAGGPGGGGRRRLSGRLPAPAHPRRLGRRWVSRSLHGLAVATLGEVQVHVRNGGTADGASPSRGLVRPSNEDGAAEPSDGGPPQRRRTRRP